MLIAAVACALEAFVIDVVMVFVALIAADYLFCLAIWYEV